MNIFRDWFMVLTVISFFGVICFTVYHIPNKRRWFIMADEHWREWSRANMIKFVLCTLIVALVPIINAAVFLTSVIFLAADYYTRIITGSRFERWLSQDKPFRRGRV